MFTMQLKIFQPATGIEQKRDLVILFTPLLRRGQQHLSPTQRLVYYQQLYQQVKDFSLRRGHVQLDMVVVTSDLKDT